jgi:SNF2 family DNA or RNA helicase
VAWAAIDPDEHGNGPWLAVGCARSEYHLCEHVPGMNFRKSDQLWRAPLSWPAWVALRTLWAGQSLAIQPALREWAQVQEKRNENAYRWRSSLDAQQWDVELDELDAATGQRLFVPQRGGAEWLYGWKRVILGDPQGNGKTPQLIRAIQLVQRSPFPGPFLVIAPASALYNWQRELSRWAPELDVRVIDGTALKRRRQIMDEGAADVYVIGWKTLRLHTRLARYPGKEFVRCDEHGGSTGKTAAQCEVHDKELNEIKWAGVIADEAHRMKDAGSKQTRAVWHLAHSADFFWPATGTLVGDNIADLWPLLHGIDPRGFPSKSKFLDLYAVKLLAWSRGTEYLGIKPETEGAFHATVQPLIRRIPKEIARPHMPPRLPVTFRNPEMTPAQRKVYAQLRKDALAELESTTVATGGNSAVAFGRLCQVSSAMIETQDGEDADGFSKQLVRLVTPSNKVDDLIDFLGDNPGPVVVCMNSPQLLALCESRLAAEKVTHCAIKAEMSASQRDQSVQWFQSGECRVILMTGRTGGEAITLTASDTVLFLQPDPSYIVNEQVIGRVDRIGQANPVRIVYSIAPDTVEVRLFQLSTDKTVRAEQVTRDADLLRWIITGDSGADQGGPNQDSNAAV